MRLWFGLCLLAACAGSAPTTSGDDADTTSEEQCLGGLPAPTCGSGPCLCCVSCGQDEGLCMGLGYHFAFGIGTCRARPAAGTLSVTAGATSLTATEVAAIADASFEISTRTNGGVLVFVGPAAISDVTCATTASGFTYYETGGRVYRNRPGSGNACTISVTAFGGVGERIEGTFSATLVDDAQPATTLELTNGTFSVERVAYP